MADDNESVTFDLSRGETILAEKDPAPKRRSWRPAAFALAIAAAAFSGYAIGEFVYLRKVEMLLGNRPNESVEALARDVALLRKRIEAIESGELRASLFVLPAVAFGGNEGAKHDSPGRDPASGGKHKTATAGTERGARNDNPSGSGPKRENFFSAAPSGRGEFSGVTEPPPAPARAQSSSAAPENRVAEAAQPARVACSATGARPLLTSSPP